MGKSMSRALFLLAAGILATGSVSAKTTLNLMVKVDLTKEWKALFAAYEKLNPDVEIKPMFQNVDWPNYYEKIVMMQAGGAAADLIMVDRQAVPYIRKNTFTDLTPMLKGDKIDKADYPEVGWKQYNHKGAQVAFPLTIFPGVMFWNKDMFAKAGVNAPAQDWRDKSFDTNDFADILRKLTKDENGDGKKDYYGTCGWTTGPILAGYGAEWIDFDKDKATANSKNMIDAWGYWYNLKDNLRVVADDAFQSQYKINWDWFSSGRIGFMSSGSWAMGMYQSQKPFKWDIAVPPMANRRATTATVDGLAIAGWSKNKKEAWEFIKWIGTNNNGSALLGDCLSGIPTLETGITRYIEREQKNHPTVNMKVLRDSVRYSDIESFNLYPRSKDMDKAIWDNMGLVDTGKKSLRAALDAIQEALTKLID